MDAEDAQLVLQPILEEVVNGRLMGHVCPFCQKSDLICEYDEGWVKLLCTTCEKSFEGMLR